MKKFTLLVIGLVVASVAMAQSIQVSEATMLAETEQGGYYYPMFSPSGDYLLTTAENYEGLRKHDLRTGRITLISDALGAGYGVRFSRDGKHIVARHYEYKDNLRYTAIDCISTTSGRTTNMRKAARNQSSPISETEEVYVTVKNKKMVLHNNGVETILTPNGEDESYFWCSVSPDAKHIVYATAHKGTWICDIKGENLVKLGWMNAPVWWGNDRVIGMQDYDDGERVLSSTIVSVNLEGKDFMTLPTAQRIAMYPAASVDGSKIAFNNEKGQIFMMEVKR